MTQLFELAKVLFLGGTLIFFGYCIARLMGELCGHFGKKTP